LIFLLFHYYCYFNTSYVLVQVIKSIKDKCS